MRALVMVWVVAAAAQARADSLDELAKRLVNARADVEALQVQLSDAQAQHGQRLRSLAGQRMELEAAVQREELKVRRLERSLDAARVRQLESTVQAEELVPILMGAINSSRERVDIGLPFQVNERNAVLDELEQHLVGGTLAPGRIVGRLWAFHEDEARLAKESGLYRQTISLDGEHLLADVVRIGMVMLFFRAGDRFGFASQRNGGWSYLEVEDGRSRDQIRSLFAQFEKKISTGYFELPNPGAGGGAR